MNELTNKWKDEWMTGMNKWLNTREWMKKWIK